MHIKQNNIARHDTTKYSADIKAVKAITDIKNIPTIYESTVNLTPAVVAQ